MLLVSLLLVKSGWRLLRRRREESSKAVTAAADLASAAALLQYPGGRAGASASGLESPAGFHVPGAAGGDCHAKPSARRTSSHLELALALPSTGADGEPRGGHDYSNGWPSL